MKKIIILLFVLIMGCGAFAQDYEVYQLESGQTVVIKQVKSNPIVTIDTWIKTGSINEDDSNNGVAHFLEHLFFKGTKNHPAGEMDRVLESKGAITNAATSKDFTHYYITIPSRHFDLAMDYHADMLLHPQIPRKEMEKERKVVIEEISKNADNPDEKVYDNLNEMLYKTHPYKRKVIGKKEIIEKISREEVLDFYNTYYSPQNMITIIIGDVEPQRALAKVKEEFQTNKKNKTALKSHMCEKPLTSQTEKIIYEPAQAGYLLIGYHGVSALNPDTYALDLLATILGQGRSSILFQKIKEQKQLAYSISSGHSSFREDGLFMISANFTPDKAQRLKKAIFEEVSQIQKQGVTPEELAKAKKIIERETYYSRESITNIASEIGYTTVLTDDVKYYDQYLDNIKKVTPADIKRVANQYLNENACAISLLLPKSLENKSAEETSTINHSFKLISELPDTAKYELDNGATMLISQNRLNDIVAISIFVKGGGFSEKRLGCACGSAFLTSAVMTKGTKNYTAVELAQALEENGIKIAPSASSDSFSIEILSTKDQLPKTMHLLNEVINFATFDDFEIEKTIKTKLNSIKESQDTPITLAIDEYKALIFENSVYANESNKNLEKNLTKVPKEDILKYYGSIFAPQNIVISVNGNVDSQFLANQFSEIFKSTDKEKFDFNTTSYKIPSLSAPKTSVKKVKDLKTAWLIMAWQTCGVLNKKDYATLQVINSILGSGMSSRLFRNVREQEGLAYQLGSGISPKVLKGAFIMYIGTNPKTLNVAKQKMLAEINRLKIEFVGDKELKEAKEKLIGNYIISLETNMDKASTIGWFEASQRGYEFKNEYESLINGVSATDIIEVANKYFNQNFVTSTVEGE